MNDTLNLKPIVPVNVTGSVLGAALAFARAVVAKAGSGRINTALGLASPTTLRIAHTPRKGNVDQRSVAEIVQIYARTDSESGAVVAQPQVQWALSCIIPQGVTQAEVLAPLYQLIGGLLENDAQLAKEFIEAQT